MNASEIRQQFLDFFKSKNHVYVKSAPLVVKDDPTLMFINAGMNQFKDYFLGNRIPGHPMVANTQKCLRVSGKHNDLEEVGHDTYHHTMFEMLGNWSFGNPSDPNAGYFKKEAIAWAWELLTEVYKLPKDRLYVSIFEGDKGDDLEIDQEAYDLWKGLIDEDRIIPASKKDNFWEMGDTGPCGPCSEIHVDLRSEEDRKKQNGLDLVNEDHPLVVEIWNLVFIQYERRWNANAGGNKAMLDWERMQDRGSKEFGANRVRKLAELTDLTNLPAKHIDTGMGFERLCMAMQQKESNYDTDVFTPLIEEIEKLTEVSYEASEEVAIAMRVIADHIRAVSFAIADGQLPSSNKAGYVIRRILRRAVRYAFTFLKTEKPFVFELVSILADQFKSIFPELGEQKDFISKVIREEEASFLKTLAIGIKMFSEFDGKKITGELAFELYDRFGFPIDLTQLMAKESGKTVDMDGFEACLQEQRNRSKDDSMEAKSEWTVLLMDDVEEFVGYDYLETEVQITRYRKVETKKGEKYHLVFNVTPFYAESGGQVGDTGYIEVGGQKTYILDTKKEGDVFVHLADKLPEYANLKFNAVVDRNKRKLTEKNHSATHLLHAALKQVLGDHVQQKGSLVDPRHLRFDFSHFQKISEEELKEVEEIVNQKVRQGISLDERKNVPIAKAQEMGATALFGEKYGDTVRVITFDPDFSMELCGGTHVASTSEIGMFKIISEASTAAGVRRIEALTSEKAEEYYHKEVHTLNEVRDLLKHPKDLVKTLESVLNENSSLKKEIEKLENAQMGNLKSELLTTIEAVDGLNFISAKVKAPSANALRQLAFDIKKDTEDLFMVIAADIKGKPQILVMLSESLVEKGYNANVIIKQLSPLIKGGGGGQPFFATAGGKDVSGLEAVVSKSKELRTLEISK